MSSVALNSHATSILFEEMERHILEITIQFCHKHRVPRYDWDERKAEALLIYVETCKSIPDYAHRNLPGFFRLVVWRRLLSKWRTEMGLEAKHRPKVEALITDVPEPDEPSFSFTAFICDLGTDAKLCIDLIFSRTGAVTEFVWIETEYALRAELRGRGWPLGRMNAAFNEIRKGLAEA